MFIYFYGGVFYGSCVLASGVISLIAVFIWCRWQVLCSSIETQGTPDPIILFIT